MRAPCSMLAILFLSFSVSAGEQKDNVPFEVYARGYFVKNTFTLPTNPAFLVVQDKASFDKMFGIAMVMGAKPKRVDDALFEKSLIAVVIKSGNTPWKYEVEKVRLDKERLIIEYKAAGTESATATFSSPLILSTSRGAYTEIVWMENGKEVGKQAVKK